MTSKVTNSTRVSTHCFAGFTFHFSLNLETPQPPMPVRMHTLCLPYNTDIGLLSYTFLGNYPIPWSPHVTRVLISNLSYIYRVEIWLNKKHFSCSLYYEKTFA